MRLLAVRHAEADPAAPGTGDAARALTERGAARFAAGVRGCRRLGWELDLILTSPLVRAVQTGALLEPLLRRPRRAAERRRTSEALAAPPGPELLAELAQAAAAAVRDPRDPDGEWCAAVVGHEPWIGALAGWLVGGDRMRPLPFKKGGMALLSGELEPGAMRLVAFLPPSALAALGE